MRNVSLTVRMFIEIAIAAVPCAMGISFFCFDIPCVAETFLMKWPCPWGALTLPDLA